MPEPAMRTRTIPVWACLSFVAGTSAILWWLIGLNAGHGPYRILGPYRVPVALEIVVGVAAVAAMVVALVVRPDPRAGHGVARPTAALLVVTGLVATGSWRLVTLNGENASIGGGLVALTSPFAVSALLAGAALAERAARGTRVRWLPLWLALAAAPAVGGLVLWS